MIASIAAAVFIFSQPTTRLTDVTLEDCDAIYYGIKQERNLGNAYRCYGAIDEVMMQIIMTLNGEGAVRDLKRVEELFARWRELDPETAEGDSARPIREAIAALRAGTLTKRLEFCDGIASSTRDSTRCDQVREFRLETDANEFLEQVGRRMTPRGQREAFTRLRRAAMAFLDAEDARGFQLFIGGTIASSAGALARDRVREHFLEHVTTVLRRSNLSAASALELQAAEDNLTEVARGDVIKQLKEEEGAIGIGRGYANAAAASTSAWLAYRNAWVNLVGTRRFPGISRSEAARAIKTVLTRERIAELQDNPLGVR